MRPQIPDHAWAARLKTNSEDDRKYYWMQTMMSPVVRFKFCFPLILLSAMLPEGVMEESKLCC